MEFQITTSDETTHLFHGESKYKVSDGGVLTVTDADDDRTLTFSPAHWQVVEHQTKKYRGIN